MYERYACMECHLAVDTLTHTGPLPAQISCDQSLIAYRPPYPTSFTHLGGQPSVMGLVQPTAIPMHGVDNRYRRELGRK